MPQNLIKANQQDVKRDRILEAAYQRFLQYGYSKTTMNEIAGDLSLSKALLYYYFADKNEVYAAVMRKLANAYFVTLEEKINDFNDLKEAIVFQVDAQHNFILDNYNFFDFFRLYEKNLPAEIWEIITDIRRAETQILSRVIQAEKDKGIICPIDDPDKVADMLLDALHGVRVSASANKKILFPRQEHLDEIHEKRLLLIDIFIRGLRN